MRSFLPQDLSLFAALEGASQAQNDSSSLTGLLVLIDSNRCTAAIVKIVLRPFHPSFICSPSPLSRPLSGYGSHSCIRHV